MKPNYYNYYIISKIGKEKAKVKLKRGSNSNALTFNHFDLTAVLHYLRARLKPVYLHFVRGEGEFLSFQAVKRGTEVYQHLFLGRRFRKIKKAVKKLTVVNYLTANVGLTNAFLITFTFGCGVIESWQKVREFSAVLTAIKRKLERRGLEVVYYFRVFEAQKSGKAHIHLLLAVDSLIEFRYDFIKRRGFIRKQKVYNKLKEVLESSWRYGFVDIQPVSSKAEAVNYLSKYVLKEGGEVESLLDREVESLREGEVKRLLLYYYLFKFGLRLFSESRDKKQEKRHRRRLDTAYNNNCDIVKWQRVRSERLLDIWNLLTATILIADSYLIDVGSWSELGIVAVRGSPEGVKIVKRRQKLEILDWREFPVRGKLLALMQFEDIKLNSKLAVKVGIGSNFLKFSLCYQ